MPRNLNTEDLINALVDMKINKKASTKTQLDFLMNELGFKQTWSYELIKKSREKIQEIYKSKVEHHLEQSKAHLEDMLEKAAKKGDLKLQLQIVQEINKLAGLYAAEKVDMTITEYKAKF